MHIPNQESRGHISPTKTYIYVGIALLILTVITVVASYINFGSLFINITIALVIATIKASLVLLYFMHLKYENKLIWSFGIFYPLVLFTLLLGLTWIDVFFRVLPK
ncbi:MAG: cytochrome C oxidase subunit IV family protein [Leptonema sp. (in: bacteria)]